MKKVLLVMLTLGIVFLGCTENTTLTGPEQTDVQKSFLKIDDNSSAALMEKKTVNSELIDGEDGGKFKINLKAGKIKAKGTLVFAKNSFDNVEKISASLAKGELALDFGRSGLKFDPDAILNVKISGIKLKKGEKEENFKFGYIEGDEFIECNYDEIIIDKKGKWIEVVNARLPHFSRFGWVR